ncbi:TPA: aldo/keto reductase [Salmonella enterica]
MSTVTETLTLNNGIKMPALGLGVFLAPPEKTAEAVSTAIRSGYRLIDTASAYMNERAVGEGIRNSGVPREELFITTKLWPGQYGHEKAAQGFKMSLERLGLEYLDMFLLHWPVPMDFTATVQSYLSMEQLLEDEFIRAIGVANFLPHHLQSLCEETGLVPALNQIELNPFYTQPETIAANTSLGIITQAWAPIGGTYLRNKKAVTNGAETPLQHPVISGLAEKYGKTPAQIVIRWHLEQGFSVIPKSVQPERIIQNANVFDFSLTAEEVDNIGRLNTGVRAGSDPELFTADSYKVDVDSQ